MTFKWKYLLTKLELQENVLGTIGIYYGRWIHGNRFCHSRTVEREARKDKDKALVQINMRGEQRKRNPQKRLRRNDRNTEEESGEGSL